MERMAADPAGCRRMGEAAAAEVRREHTWDAKAAQVTNIYRTVLRTN
jgi:glycosyltransferase involved in cell wall biosynthesis